jgi:uncharacterized membrane protein
MFERLPALFRSALYALRGGFLIRPLAIALVLGAAGAVLSSLEESFIEVPSQQDPGVAQVILSSIATSIMIVFAILLMTLTLASTQLSPRILVSFVRDRTTQWTLGVFLGTFSYCMAALPAARALPHPFVPAATVSGAMLLALGCVGWLIYFIHHVSHLLESTAFGCAWSAGWVTSFRLAFRSFGYRSRSEYRRSAKFPSSLPST